MVVASDTDPFRIQIWWCCLATLEKTAFQRTTDAFLLIGGYTLSLDTWNAIWQFSGGSDDARRIAFLSVYQLEETTEIDPITLQETEVIKSTLDNFWASAIDQFNVIGVSCDDGCALIPPYLRIGS